MFFNIKVMIIFILVYDKVVICFFIILLDEDSGIYDINLFFI